MTRIQSISRPRGAEPSTDAVTPPAARSAAPTLLRLGALVSRSAKLRLMALSPDETLRSQAVAKVVRRVDTAAGSKAALSAAIEGAALLQTLADDADPHVQRSALLALGDVAAQCFEANPTPARKALAKAGVRPESLVRGWALRQDDASEGHSIALRRPCERFCLALPPDQRDLCLATLMAHPNRLTAGAAARICIATGKIARLPELWGNLKDLPSAVATQARQEVLGTLAEWDENAAELAQLRTDEGLALAREAMEAHPKLANAVAARLSYGKPQNDAEGKLLMASARLVTESGVRKNLFIALQELPAQHAEVAALLAEWAKQGPSQALLDGVGHCPRPQDLPPEVLDAFAKAALALGKPPEAQLQGAQLLALAHGRDAILKAFAGRRQGPLLQAMQDSNFLLLARRHPAAYPVANMGIAGQVAALEDAARREKRLDTAAERVNWFVTTRALYKNCDDALAMKAVGSPYNKTALVGVLQAAPECAAQLALATSVAEVLKLVDADAKLLPGLLKGVCSSAALARHLRDNAKNLRGHTAFAKVRGHVDGHYTLEALLVINHLRAKEGYPYSTRLAKQVEALVNACDFDLAAPNHLLARMSLREMFPYKDRILARLKALYPEPWAAMDAGSFDPNDAVHAALGYARMMELPHAFKLLSKNDVTLANVQRLAAHNIRRSAFSEQSGVRMEAAFLAYEAKLLHDMVIAPAQKRAAALGRPLMLVLNCTYGGTAGTPLPLRKLASQGVRVTATKQSSTDGHPGHVLVPDVLSPKLFSPDDMRFIVEQQPVVIIVDGSQKGHLPDSFRGYRNFAILANQAFGHAVPEGVVFRPGDEHEPIQTHLKGLAEQAQAPRAPLNFFTASLPLGRKERNDFAPNDEDPMVARLTDWKQVKGAAFVCVQTAIPYAQVSARKDAQAKLLRQAAYADEHQLAYFDDRDAMQAPHMYLGSRGVKIKPTAIHRQARNFYKKLERA